MAKVSGPLFSLEARGKIADAVVYFPWKGLHVVRQWLAPANPQSADQGDQRLICGALGRATSVVGTANAFAAEVRTYMDAGLTWPSAIAKWMIDNIVNDGTAWDALVTEYEAHTAKTDWDAEAAALNIQQFDVAYKGCADLAAPGAILYCLAKFSTGWELLGTKGFQRTPYTTALASWALANIQAMVAEF
jgi:hypothetical protein